MNLSAWAFLIEDSSTSSNTLNTVESSYSEVTSTVIFDDRFTVPETTFSPGMTSLGTDSPVSAWVSMDVYPDTMVPSRGTFSPGRTSIVSPTLTSSGPTVSVLPSLIT